MKEFTPKEGIDYEETFLPVAILMSIRVIFSITALYNYQIWQIDVKTTLLNGSLDEFIYLMQPDDFVESSEDDMLCKHKRSFNGLQYASRAWNTFFDKAIKTFDYDQCLRKFCLYKKRNGD